MFISAGLIESDNNKEPEREIEGDEDSNEFLNMNVDVEEDDEEAFNYVAGYIGHKLGFQPSNEQHQINWISKVGGGKLHQPKEELIQMCRNCDQEFSNFHRLSIRKVKNPLKKLEDKIAMKFPLIPQKVSKLFIKVKFYARLKRLNFKLKERQFLN